MRASTMSQIYTTTFNNHLDRNNYGKPLFNFGLHPEGWIAIMRFDGDCESYVLEHEYYFSRSDSELLLVNYILNRSDEKVYFYENNNLNLIMTSKTNPLLCKVLI